MATLYGTNHYKLLQRKTIEGLQSIVESSNQERLHRETQHEQEIVELKEKLEAAPPQEETKIPEQEKKRLPWPYNLPQWTNQVASAASSARPPTNPIFARRNNIGPSTQQPTEEVTTLASSTLSGSFTSGVETMTQVIQEVMNNVPDGLNDPLTLTFYKVIHYDAPRYRTFANGLADSTLR